MQISELLAAIDEEISRLTQARSLLAADDGSTGTRSVISASAKAGTVKRVLSPEARKRIADAQRKRWAAQKKATR
jgi:hypothetical protein